MTLRQPFTDPPSVRAGQADQPVRFERPAGWGETPHSVDLATLLSGEAALKANVDCLVPSLEGADQKLPVDGREAPSVIGELRFR